MAQLLTIISVRRSALMIFLLKLGCYKLGFY